MPFNPNDHLTKLSGKEYLEVKWRIAWFRDQYPDGIIRTEHIEITDQRAVFKATITKFDGEADIGSATGYGSETPKDFKDYIEKAETKAVGRALAALGFGTQFAPELDEGERIVDSPVQRPQSPPNAPKPANAGPDTPTHIDREKAMRALHAAANERGFSHDDLRMIADNEERTASNGERGIASLKDAPDALLVHVKMLIETKPDKLRDWLNQQQATQAELNPSELDVPSPRRHPDSYAQ